MRLEGVAGLNEVLGGGVFLPGGKRTVHFNDVLGVTASILIMFSGGNLLNYLSSGKLEKCSSTPGVYPH